MSASDKTAHMVKRASSKTPQNTSCNQSAFIVHRVAIRKSDKQIVLIPRNSFVTCTLTSAAIPCHSEAGCRNTFKDL